MPVFAPMPIASVRTALTANAGVRRICRRAKRTSWPMAQAGISFPDRRPCELAERAERGLRRVQSEPEILVGERRVDVGRLVPVRIPADADLCAALVFAQADRRN